MNAFAAREAATAAGRMCPADYVYPPAVLAREPDIAAKTLYVAGGIYGNLEAIDAIERLAEAERDPPVIVFNGDYHWFDAEPGWFAAVERGAAPHLLMRGNIETEIARPGEIGAGCGCAYPESVDDGTVERSNLILAELRAAADGEARARLAQLPMHLVARVGGLRVAIVHGDAASLAGWRFAHDALSRPGQAGWLEQVRRESNADIFASTHTCLAALRHFRLPGGELTVVNNGASGMPNFAGSGHGLMTRISGTPSPHRSLYGRARDGVHIDAIPLAYDRDGFIRRFLARWPAGSAAHASYFGRITEGPAYEIGLALG